jgi:hypothetical protein
MPKYNLFDFFEDEKKPKSIGARRPRIVLTRDENVYREKEGENPRDYSHLFADDEQPLTEIAEDGRPRLINMGFGRTMEEESQPPQPPPPSAAIDNRPDLMGISSRLQTPLMSEEADNAAPPPELRPQLTDKIRWSNDRLENLQDFENNPVRNNDRGFLGRLKDIGRELVIGAGTAYKNSNNPDPDARLAETLGGGISGALNGGFNPKADEERLRLAQISQEKQNLGQLYGQQKIDQDRRMNEIQMKNAELKPVFEQQKINLRKTSLENQILRDARNLEERIRAAKARETLAENKWDEFFDDEGRVWKVYKNRSGNDGKPVREPFLDEDGQQAIKAEHKMYDTFDPFTGQAVRIKGNQLFAGGASMVVGNANRTQSADTANVNNLQQWQTQVQNIDAKRVELTNSGNAKNSQAIQLEEEAKKLEATDDGTGNMTAKAAAMRVDAAKLKAEANAELNEAQNLKYPEKPKTVEAQTVKVGKYSGQSFRLADIRSLFPGQTDAQIRQKITANGGTLVD